MVPHIIFILFNGAYIMSTNYKLSKPITLINGNEISEIVLDWDALTMADLKTSNKIAKMIADPSLGDVDTSTLSPRLNSDLRIAIAWCAAIKGTPGLMVNDVLKISMIDALCLSEESLTNYLFK